MYEHLLERPPLSLWVKSRPLLANLVLAVIYWGFAIIGYWLASIHEHGAPLWPPSGLAFAAVVVGGRTLLPGILLGALGANFYAGLGITPSFAIAVGNALEAGIAAFMLHTILNRVKISRETSLPTWLVFSSIVAPAASASIGAFSILYLREPWTSTSFLDLSLSWWAGNATGALVMAPVLLSLARFKVTMDGAIKSISIIALCVAMFAVIYYFNTGALFLILAVPILFLANHWMGAAGCSLATLGFVLLYTLLSILPTLQGGNSSMHEEPLFFDMVLPAMAVASIGISTFNRRWNFFIPATILLVGWAFSSWLFFSLRSATTKLDEVRFLELVADSEKDITNRLNTYTDVLRASASHYISSGGVTRNGWHTYVSSLEIQKRYPGINGIGFVRPFTSKEVDAYLTDVRQNELPDFTIKEVPEVKPPPLDTTGYTHYIITHIEPLATNYQYLGLDIASEKHRQVAAQRSRDSGLPTITDRIDLLQDGKACAGFLLYVPMYKQGLPLQSVQERQKAFIGWTYAPFITEHFLHGVLSHRSGHIEFDIHDTESIHAGSFVYSTKRDRNWDTDPRFDHISMLDLGGQTFSIGWTRGSTFGEQRSYSATITAASLALGTCLLAGLILSLQNTNRRTNAMVETRTAELQETNRKLKNEVNKRLKVAGEAKAARKFAESANLAKTEFLAVMSHEIRTPMNSVIGFSELLSASKLEPEQKQWTNYILSSGNALLRIINDILDFSKIEAGKLKLEAIPYSPTKAVEEVVGSFSTLALEKGIDVKFEKIGHLPQHVIGDPIRLKQVVTNLIGNALKFTEHGSVRATIEWKGGDRGLLSTRIIDTGVGIPANRVDTLFEKFTQVDTSTTRKFGGTGLGLAICKRLVELMGGSIWATSKRCYGTTMAFDIPLAVSHKKKELTIPSFEVPGKPVNLEQQVVAEVLLVEDNDINVKLARTVLERLGCKVTIAKNGIQALRIVSENYFPIIFMDCLMPAMDGFEATREIRKLESSKEVIAWANRPPITIVALTANCSPEDREKCIQSGMDDFIRKPCRVADFKNALDSYLVPVP